MHTPNEDYRFLGESVNTLLFGEDIVTEPLPEPYSLLKPCSHTGLSYTFTAALQRLRSMDLVLQ